MAHLSTVCGSIMWVCVVCMCTRLMSCIWEIRLIYMWDVTHSHVCYQPWEQSWHIWVLCVKVWCVCVCCVYVYTTHAYVRYDSFICGMWLVRMYVINNESNHGTSEYRVWKYDVCVCVVCVCTRLMHMRDMTHLYVGRDSFICILSTARAITAHLNTALCECVLCVCVHDLSICGMFTSICWTWLIRMYVINNESNHSTSEYCVWNYNVSMSTWLIHIFVRNSSICGTWLFLLCVVTHLHVCHQQWEDITAPPMIVSTENTTPPQSSKPRNSNSSVQIQIEPKSRFEFIPRDTEKSEFLDLVDFGDYVFNANCNSIGVEIAHAQTQTPAHTNTQKNVHSHTHAHTPAHRHAHTHPQTHTHTHTHLEVSCENVFCHSVHSRTHTHIHVHTHKYTHTHTHTQTHNHTQHTQSHMHTHAHTHTPKLLPARNEIDGGV